MIIAIILTLSTRRKGESKFEKYTVILINEQGSVITFKRNMKYSIRLIEKYHVKFLSYR